jgi:hypothetical protein
MKEIKKIYDVRFPEKVSLKFVPVTAGTRNFLFVSVTDRIGIVETYTQNIKKNDSDSHFCDIDF